MRVPSPATVIATLALMVAASGTTYAAIKLPANSVTSVQVKNGSLTKADFKPGQIKDGKPGVDGAPGAAGAAGAPGLAGVVIVTGGTTAVCPDGKRVIGGGAQVQGVSGGTLIRSQPSLDGTSWIAAVTSPSVVASYAICATTS